MQPDVRPKLDTLEAGTALQARMDAASGEYGIIRPVESRHYFIADRLDDGAAVALADLRH
jgi:hypothetical protein